MNEYMNVNILINNVIKPFLQWNRYLFSVTANETKKVFLNKDLSL